MSRDRCTNVYVRGYGLLRAIKAQFATPWQASKQSNQVNEGSLTTASYSAYAPCFTYAIIYIIFKNMLSAWSHYCLHARFIYYGGAAE